ncbi:hypothetical protein J4204_05875 [Candidatus Woesearchaeota archaeon]|nr:hypothetical protein [Candidatus Woesearchaeota archaeon]
MENGGIEMAEEYFISVWRFPREKFTKEEYQACLHKSLEESLIDAEGRSKAGLDRVILLKTSNSGVYKILYDFLEKYNCLLARHRESTKRLTAQELRVGLGLRDK